MTNYTEQKNSLDHWSVKKYKPNRIMFSLLKSDVQSEDNKTTKKSFVQIISYLKEKKDTKLLPSWPNGELNLRF